MHVYTHTYAPTPIPTLFRIIYICIYVYIHIYIYIIFRSAFRSHSINTSQYCKIWYQYDSAHIHTYIHASIHIYINSFKYTHPHLFPGQRWDQIPSIISTNSFSFDKVRMHTYIHTYIHTYKHTNIHTNTHTYIHTHPHLFPGQRWDQILSIYPQIRSVLLRARRNALL